MANILAKMAVQISANTAEFNKALQKTNKEINTFTGQIKGIAGTLGVAFGVQQIAEFTFEAAKLAGAFEGVKAAFDKLENSKILLRDLQRATAGTVSELNLMKRAVQFSNFGLELQQLPKLMQFAALRAQQTGQSVDYLVDSIVTGLGRKSVLILDNLGISASMLNEEVARTGDFMQAAGNIVDKELKKMGNLMDTSVTASDQLSASIEDLKIAYGNLANSAGFTAYIKSLASALNSLPDAVDWNIKLAKSLLGIREESQRGADTTWDEGPPKKYITTIASLNDELASLKSIYEQTDVTDKNKLLNIISQTEAIQKQIDAINSLKYAVQDRGPVKETVIGKPDTSFFNPSNVIPGINEISAAIAIVNQRLLEGQTSIATWGETMRIVADETAQKMVDISGLIVGGLVEIASAFGEAAVTGAKDFGRAFLVSLGRFAQQFGALLIATGLGQIALKSGNPYLMIAGGAALIAAGSAIAKLLSKPPTLSAGGGGSFSQPIGSGSVTGLGQGIFLSGDFKLQGYELELLLDRQTYKNSRTGG